MQITLPKLFNRASSRAQSLGLLNSDHKSASKAPRASSRANAEAFGSYFQLVVLVVVLCAFGLMMVLSASSVEALRVYGSSWVYFQRQGIWLILGLIVLWVTSRIDYQRWRDWSMPMLAISGIALLLVLVPGVGITVWGSTRWLGAGPLRVQPSEIAKFALMVFSCDLLARRAHLLGDWRATTKPVVVVFLIFAFLVMVQPDMGTTLVTASVVVTALFVAGTPIKRMLKLGGVAVVVATLMAFLEPYRRERLMSFRDPFADASNTGYQMVQSLVGIGSGGVPGIGLGESRAKWGFLPNAHTDFIFSVIAEELGMIGAVLVLGLFIGFAVLGARIAWRAPDHFGSMMAACITAWIVFQAFLNIAAVIGLVPVTGVPLPFLSQGGTSLVILLAATGVLLNIAHRGELANRSQTLRTTAKAERS